MSTFAVNAQKASYTLEYYSARIFLCDTERNSVIFRELQSRNLNDDTIPAGKYNEFPIDSALFLDIGGSKLEQREINVSHLDKNCTIVIQKIGQASKILIIKINE